MTAPPLVIESLGSTSLVQLGDIYYLDSNGGGTGPESTSGGVAVLAVQSGNWTPIAAEQTASGYEVAWHDNFTGNYKVWTTDSSGNYTGTVSGSLALELLEPSFHQDLNGDGIIGVVSTKIATDSSTSLVQVGNNFYLDDVNSGTGPSLKFEGEEYVAGDPSDSWTPVGAVQTANGYDVALKWGNYYSISTTDSNGNFTAFAQTQLLGSGLALEQWETTFNQDLNGDGTIGVVSTTIATNGSTSLDEACGSLYFDVAGSAVASGPSLKYGGFDFSVDQTNWVPIGAVATATGYQIAWELPGGGQFMVWNTDSNGNYVSNDFNPSNIWANVSGNSIALELLEASFHQDLNGDGVIGIPGTIEQAGATSLVATGNDFMMYAIGTAAGTEMKYGGTPWTGGDWGGWTPFAAEATTTGYEVAFRIAGANLYSVWNTDANGNLTADSISTVSGNSAVLQALETSFHQDLNGDGTIGLPVSSTLIESFGSTDLVQTGNNYFLDNGDTATQLKYDGAAFTAGEWGGWTPVGVEAIPSGYEVAFKFSGADLYTVWDTDAAGNIMIDPIGSVSGSTAALAALEKSLHQDLNGDGMIGNPSLPIPIEQSGSTSLVQTGDDYFLDANGTSNGPVLQSDGAPWTDGHWGNWTPVGVEATANGYEVAFNLLGTGQYTVWNTDANGNITSNTIGTVAANSAALEAAETSFHQDLNGDGIIGDPSIPSVIESSGSTSLTRFGGNFFLDANGTSNGPELKDGGAAWTIGQWGAWTPIGTEATATGYEVAFKLGNADLYTVWNTDANGNITDDTMGSVQGSNVSLQSIETSFHQDLNNDGVIGLPSGTSMAASGAAPITAPASGNVILAGTADSDSFVFTANFGNDTVTGFQPGVDQVDLDHTLFASVSDLLAHTSDNAAGSAVVTVGADQSITFDHVSTQALQQHAGDFHLV